jgi:hypothetical protein
MTERSSRIKLAAAALLLITIVAWLVLVYLSRLTEPWVIEWTRNLLGWVLLATIVDSCLLYIALTKDTKRALLRCTLTVIVVTTMIVLVEVPAAFSLVHWHTVMEHPCR